MNFAEWLADHLPADLLSTFGRLLSGAQPSSPLRPARPRTSPDHTAPLRRTVSEGGLSAPSPFTVPVHAPTSSWPALDLAGLLPAGKQRDWLRSNARSLNPTNALGGALLEKTDGALSAFAGLLGRPAAGSTKRS